MGVRIKDDFFVMNGWLPLSFQHYEIEKVLDAFEVELRDNEKIFADYSVEG